MKRKIGTDKIGDFVVNVWENRFFNVSSPAEVIIENEEPKEISPDDLKAKIEETAQRFSKYVENEIEECRKEFGGKCVNYKNDSILKKKAAKYIQMLTRLNMYPSFEEINVVRANARIDEFEEFIKKIKKHSFDKNSIYLDLYMEYDGEYDEDGMEVLYVTYVGKKIVLREPNKIVSRKPDEQTIRKIATLDTLYKNVLKGIKYDCEAVQDYINGDLTFKGFIKKIDISQNKTC